MAELRRHVEALRAVHLPELPPFCAGAVGYAGYDTVRYFERLPNAPPDDRQVPDLAFAFYDRMVVFDNVAKTIVVVAMARLDRPGATVESAYDDARRRVDALVEQLATRSADLELVDIRPEGEVNLEFRSNFTQPQFEKAVEKCVEYIRAGDIFQVVLSQRLEVPLTAHPFEIYRTLADRQSQSLHVLRPHAQRDAGRQLAGGDGPRGRWPGDRSPLGRHPPPRQDGRGRPQPFRRNCWPIPRSGPST